MQGCFGGFWRRRVRLTGWQGGFRVTGCRCAGRLWCTGWRVRILWCRSIFAGGGRGIFVPLFLPGWVFAIGCGCIWKKNTESQAFQACSWLEHALAPHRRSLRLLNQSLPFLSPHKTNTIIREERADRKSPCSLYLLFFVCSFSLWRKPK